MHRLVIALFATSSLSTISQVANAADFPRKAPPPIVAAWSWSGFYVGAHVGAGWGTKEQTIFSLIDEPVEPTFNDGTHTVNGILGGVQVGYNWQPVDRWVLGVEAQFSWADLEGKGSCGVFGLDNCRTRADWLGTAVVRLGWTAGRALIYVKGGGAWIHDSYEIDFVEPAAGTLNTASQTRWGWMFGTGVEYALTANWSAKIEYNYLGFGTRTITLNNAAALLITDPIVPITQHIHLIKLGVNYRFAPGVVAARY
jgi:outer membrane immunogenic protein